jgi:hydrogenase maturation factor HypE
MLAIAGGADVVGAVFRNAITQLTLPDHLRGRISSIHAAAVTSGPRLGDFEAGAVAAATSLQFSVVSGGILCVGGAFLISRWIPELASYVGPVR